VSAASRAGWGVGLLVAASVAGVAIAAGISDTVRVLDLSRDPATLSGSPAHDGLLTNLSAFVWSATVAVTWFGAWVVERVDRAGERVRFLRWSAVITVPLMIDDIFLIHERLVPRLGFGEEWLFVAYAVSIVALLLGHRRVVSTTAWPILGLAFGFFAVALARNRVVTLPSAALPDTYAFIGAGLWLVFYLHTTVGWVERTISPERSAL
jgi:hypothetical protein